MSQQYTATNPKWDWDKNLNDFEKVVENLRKEGFESRADVVQYLLDRVKRAESMMELYTTGFNNK